MYSVMQRRQEEYRQQRSCRFPLRTCPRPVSVVDDPYEALAPCGLRFSHKTRVQFDQHAIPSARPTFSGGTIPIESKRVIVIDRVSNVRYTIDLGHVSGK